MATEVILPRLGQGMESGTIVRWLKSEGEPVQKGEPLFELDTDKVTQEVEAEAAGVLLKIAVAEGEVPVGQTVAFIGAEGEDVPDVAAAAPPNDASNTVLQAEEEARSEPAPPPEHAAAADGNGRVKASPLARRLAPARTVASSPRTSSGRRRVPRVALVTSCYKPPSRPARSSASRSRASARRSRAG